MHQAGEMRDESIKEKKRSDRHSPRTGSPLRQSKTPTRLRQRRDEFSGKEQMYTRSAFAKERYPKKTVLRALGETG